MSKYAFTVFQSRCRRLTNLCDTSLDLYYMVWLEVTMLDRTRVMVFSCMIAQGQIGRPGVGKAFYSMQREVIMLV